MINAQKYLLLTLAALLLTSGVYGQTSSGLKVSGYAAIGGAVYAVSGINNRRSPYSFHTNAGLNFAYRQFSIPVNIAYSNQQFSYGYALNRIGITPTYKWAKVHLGWSSMSFSPYVMNRKQFLGAGIELTPGILRASAFYGTLENPSAIQDTILYGAILLPSFSRKALGVKLGVGNTRHYFDLSIFNARDDLLSLDDNTNVNIKPEDNLVIGSSFKVSLMRFFSIESNLALSGLTRNKNSQPLVFEQQNLVSPFLSATNSTQASIAGNVRARFIIKSQSLGLEFKRVEPNFRSLGLPFIQTDIQSYLAYTNLSFLKSKIALQLQGGLQNNNLRHTKAIQTNRVIGNVNISYRPNKSLSFSVQHNNFTNDTEGGTIELSDTLRFTLTSAQTGFLVRISSKAKTDKWHTSLSLNQQSIQDLSPIARISGDISSLQSTLSLTKDFDEREASIKGSILWANFDGSFDNQKRYGGSLGLSKKLFEKAITTRLEGRYFRNDVGRFSNGSVVNGSFNVSWAVNSSNNLNFNLFYINKNSIASRSFNELRSGINYQVRL